MTERSFPVPDALVGERVDTALSRMLGMSRSKVADIAASGGIRAGGVALGKSDPLPAVPWIDVDVPDPEPSGVVPTPVGMDIVYDCEDFVVVDKPVGVAAHASMGWDGPTVLGALAAAGYRISTSGVPERQGIVHRLDVGTSGLMAVAKSELAYTMLKRAFRNRTVDKVYHALVQGRLDPSVGTIEAPIGRHPGRDFKMAVVAGGRESVTHYETLEAMPHACLVEVHLETGRTHQIRVHMAAVGHPCVGDPMYGSDPVLAARLGLERQWLHAVRLGFAHPRTGEWVAFESPYPADLERALDMMRHP
ncbi:RluA family pseudouridine synthase [Buchananella felis]|uniref:RluA family pseudouridine synthase n=1 Tax=Buchananella felis TaxID=3231492 RepID=UPI003527A637